MNFKMMCGAVCILCVAFLISIVLFARRSIFTESFVTQDSGELTSLDELNDTSTIYIIKFYAKWCPYCKKIKDIWDKVYGQLNGIKKSSGETIKVFQIGEDNMNISKFKETFNFDIDGFPTIIKMKNNKIDVYEGSRTYESIKSFSEN